jgi:hypothetical protein
VLAIKAAPRIRSTRLLEPKPAAAFDERGRQLPLSQPPGPVAAS